MFTYNTSASRLYKNEFTEFKYGINLSDGYLRVMPLNGAHKFDTKCWEIVLQKQFQISCSQSHTFAYSHNKLFFVFCKIIVKSIMLHMSVSFSQ